VCPGYKPTGPANEAMALATALLQLSTQLIRRKAPREAAAGLLSAAAVLAARGSPSDPVVEELLLAAAATGAIDENVLADATARSAHFEDSFAVMRAHFANLERLAALAPGAL